MVTGCSVINTNKNPQQPKKMKTTTKSIRGSWLLTTSISLLIGLTLSCQKVAEVPNQETTAIGTRLATTATSQDALQPDDFQVQEGALHFKDLDAFVRVHKFLASKTNDERVKFAETAGFKSLLIFQRELTKAIEAANAGLDFALFKGLLGKYSDIITIDSEKTVLFRVENPLLAAYQNRDGVVYIGQALYKFGDKEQTIVLDGDPTKINLPESSTVKHIVHRTNPATAPGGRMNFVCRYFEDKIKYGTDCDDRYSRLTVIPQFQTIDQGNGQYTILVTPYTLAFPFKKNFWGNWVHYSTNNDLYVSWKFTCYTSEPNQPNGPSNPIMSTVGQVFSNYDSNIQYSGSVAGFSNLNNGNGGSLYWEYEFPSNSSGWHRMVCVQNDMICP